MVLIELGVHHNFSVLPLHYTPPLGNIPVNIFAIILPADAAGPRPEVFKCITEKQCLEKLTHLNERVNGNIASDLVLKARNPGQLSMTLALASGSMTLALASGSMTLALASGSLALALASGSLALALFSKVQADWL